MDIKGYTLKTELKNANSGFSKWGFAEKNGKEYFVKELINPIYPLDNNAMSEDLLQKKREICMEFEERYKKFYEKINASSHGILVRINEFLRCGSHYYLITEKIEGDSVTTEEIALLSDEEKLLLFKTVAHGFYNLHSAGIVHFDTKPSNILLKKSRNGKIVAKIIDFDSGFIKDEVLKDKEMGGDLTYFAPETFRAMCGEDVKPDEKADVFALGLVFHEYYCGNLPSYNTTEYEYPYEAVLNGDILKADDEIPALAGRLITSMLDSEPAKRPSAEDIIKHLNSITGQISAFPEIKQLLIHFGGDFGKSIYLTENAIKYKNTVTPAARAEMDMEKDAYPYDYLAEKKKDISGSDIYNDIVSKIENAGLWDLVSLSDTSRYKGEICQCIKCICADGSAYAYYAENEPDAAFKAIVSVLSAYCNFPEKISLIVPPEDVTPKENPTRKNGDWFKRAGDL